MNSMRTLLQWHFNTKILLLGIVVFMGVGTLSAASPVNSGSYQVFFDPTTGTFSSDSGNGPAVLNYPWHLATGQSLKGYIQSKACIQTAVTATCSLDLFLPVGGQLNLGHQSTLSLLSDLTLTSSCALIIGTGTGNYATIDTASAATGMATIFLNGDFSLPTSLATTLTVSASANLTIDGGNRHFDFSISKIKVDTGATLTLKNMIIDTLNSSTALTGAGTVYFQNCIINASGSSWNNGVITVIKDMVVLRGGGVVTLGGPTNFTIAANSMLVVDEGTTLKYAQSDNSRTRFLFGNQTTSVLYIRGGLFSAPSTNNGVILLGGTIYLDNAVAFYNDATGDGTGAFNSNSAKAITLGDGSSAANDVLVKVFAGANFTVNGYLFDQSA